MNEDEIDAMLRDALKEQPSTDFEDFETEFDAIRALVRERNPRAIIAAAACLAAATSCLRVSLNIEKELIPDDARRVTELIKALVGTMPRDQFTYIPAAMASLLLRKD